MVTRKHDAKHTCRGTNFKVSVAMKLEIYIKHASSEVTQMIRAPDCMTSGTCCEHNSGCLSGAKSHATQHLQRWPKFEPDSSSIHQCVCCIIARE